MNRITSKPTRLQMADIARMAGVSASTVSRALSGSSLVNAETKERIGDLARRMNYQINIGAANLRKGAVRNVGVIVLGQSLQSISDPFILSLIGHIADALDAKGLNLLLQRITPEREPDIAQLYATGQVSGLLIIGQLTRHETLNELHDQHVPMVVWGAKLPDSHYPVVGGDNYLGGLLATSHLVEQGCRELAFLGDVQHPEVMLRYQGYLQAHVLAGLQADPRLYKPITFGDQAMRQTLSDWLEHGVHFDGILATSDVAAHSLIAALKEKQLSVPEDIRVVGYDDVQMSSYLHPTLTSVRQPTEQAGHIMVELLLKRLNHEDVQSVMLPTTLSIRESSTALTNA